MSEELTADNPMEHRDIAVFSCLVAYSDKGLRSSHPLYMPLATPLWCREPSDNRKWLRMRETGGLWDAFGDIVFVSTVGANSVTCHLCSRRKCFIEEVMDIQRLRICPHACVNNSSIGP